MDPLILHTLAATLIRRYGDGLLDGTEDVGEKLLDKGADALAATAVGGLIGWLKARNHKPAELDAKARSAIEAPNDANALQALAGVIGETARGVEGELAALVRVAEEAAAVRVTHIRFGGVKSGVYVEAGAVAHIARLDVDIQ